MNGERSLNENRLNLRGIFQNFQLEMNSELQIKVLEKIWSLVQKYLMQWRWKLVIIYIGGFDPCQIWCITLISEYFQYSNSNFSIFDISAI
jgi:hypothetical protein